MHFFSPVPAMKLVEIINAYDTSEDTIETGKAVAKGFGKEFVTVQDVPMFIANRVMCPMMNEAAILAGENVCSYEDIDKACELGYNLPMGPLKLADFIGIDVIVGFPGETEEDFRTTYDFLAGLEPAFLHIFPFSERPGTPAVEMPGKVQASVATRRAAQLEALCAKLHAAFCARAVGSEDSVLFESTRRGGMMFGFTGNYRRVKAPYDKARVNTVCRVRLGAMDESHDLMGEIRD